MFDIEDYDYDLPEELIAQVPVPDRDESRLLVVDRSSGSMKDRHFRDLPELLLPGDLLVVNDTRVVPARIFGRKESGGRIEILVLEHADKETRRPRPAGVFSGRPNGPGREADCSLKEISQGLLKTWEGTA